MKTNGTRYSPAFKFQVVLEALKAEGKGTEAQVARAYGVHPPALANGRSAFKRRKYGEANEGPSCLVHYHYSSRVTCHKFFYRSLKEYLIGKGLAENRGKKWFRPRGAGPRFLWRRV